MLQSLDVQVVGSYIAEAWKKYLNTGDDPANGRWYTNGANGDNIGLYGGLTDALPAGLVFNQNALTYLPKQVVAASGIVNNSQGHTPQATLTLSYAHSDSSSTSHAITNSVKVGVGVDIKAGFDFVVKGEATVKFSVEYTFSYTSTTTEMTSDTQTFSEAVPVNVPTGKIYKAVLLASVQSIQVPYTATINVSGNSETWFEDRVNGHYNWMMPIGFLFGLINQYGIAGQDSSLYRNLGGSGAVVVSGTLNAQQTADFQAQIYDITDGANAKVDLVTGRQLAVASPGESVVPEGTLVQTIDFPRQTAPGPVAVGVE